ncbi:MAG: hypothetical protein ACOCUS_06700, partial [Polyangiales bacterium]
QYERAMITRTTRRASVAAILLAAALTCTAVRPAQATEPADTVEELAGIYRNEAEERNRRARNEAIDEVVGEMSFLVRGIARNRLEDANPLDRRIAIRTSGEHLTVSFDDRSYTARLGGSGRLVEGITGDELRLTFRVRGDRLFQRFDGGDKGRLNVFERQDDGDLVLAITIWADRLPSNVRYSLRYSPVE